MNDIGLPSHSGINWNMAGDVGTAVYGGGDSKMVAIFYNRPMHQQAQSVAEGRPVYKDTPYVRIHPPGERHNIVDRPATQQDASRFPIQWNQYLKGQEQRPDGTPIDLLYPEHPAIAATLRANGVFTVEQCAELSGPAIDNIGMGSQRYSNDAKKYMEVAGRGVKASQLRHELEDRDRQIHTLSRQVEEMKEIIANLQHANMQSTNLEQVQAMIAGAMARPQHMPARSFDTSTSMINATHPSKATSKPLKGIVGKKSRVRL